MLLFSTGEFIHYIIRMFIISCPHFLIINVLHAFYIQRTRTCYLKG